MKAKVRVLFLSSVCLVWPAFLPAGVDERCVVKCMERSGCWSGGSVTMPGYCNNKPELCNIECSTDSWGAISYSWKDKTSGWSYGKSNRADAVRMAIQACVKEGGAKCILQTSFNGICGSVAADGDLVAWGNADTKPNAQRRALAECARLGAKKCALQATICSISNSNAGRRVRQARLRRPGRYPGAPSLTVTGTWAPDGRWARTTGPARRRKP
jgi:hypothetical protein